MCVVVQAGPSVETERFHDGEPIPDNQPLLMTGGVLRPYQLEGYMWLRVGAVCLVSVLCLVVPLQVVFIWSSPFKKKKKKKKHPLPPPPLPSFLLSWMFEHDCLDTRCFGCLMCMFFCICTCSVQLSMFHMERRYRNMLIILLLLLLSPRDNHTSWLGVIC